MGDSIEYHAYICCNDNCPIAQPLISVSSSNVNLLSTRALPRKSYNCYTTLIFALVIFRHRQLLFLQTLLTST